MGSSSRKRNEKKRDFAKPKLKVGKSRPKASNTTDTSFKSKGITLKAQSISTLEPPITSQFQHHISLLGSRSETQRRDSLSYISSAISNRPARHIQQFPGGVLLPKILPLALDGSDGVRGQLVRLLRALEPEDVEAYAEKILLYVRAGMTHLAAGIRDSALDILSWALDCIGPSLVSCPGGWIKTLKYFAVMMGWPFGESQQNAAQMAKNYSHGESKALIKVLTNLNGYLRRGLRANECYETGRQQDTFPLTAEESYNISKRSNAFAYLNLFGSRRDEDGDMYTEWEDRRQALHVHLAGSLVRGFRDLKKGGGETGRIASTGEQIVTDSMTDFESLRAQNGASV